MAFMVHEDHEKNALDQRHLSAELREAGVEVVFCTFASPFRVDAERRLLLGAAGDEVAVVYYRTGYGPETYSGESAWACRRLIETSRAVKCPSILGQLAGTKKVQQALSSKADLERFVSSDDADRILRVCATQVYPSDPAAAPVVQRALAEPRGWILKPQREGGGNNLHGTDIVEILTEGGSKLKEFVLMEKIVGPPHPAWALARDDFTVALRTFDGVSELGIYHAAVFDPRSQEPSFKIPPYLLNRQRDVKDGKTSQKYANFLDQSLREDLERMKKIRLHRGLRHYWGIRVRGQHTKTTGRRGAGAGPPTKKK